METTPLRTLDDIINDLQGFGIAESEDIISLNVNNRTVQLRIKNLPTEEEINSLLAAEEFKGHMWVQRIRAEILSRSISWMNGVVVTGTEYVAHPLRDKISVNIRVALRDVLLTWGVETISILWKILMVHNQKIEDNLIESFPDTVIMTNFEQRFFQQTMKELEEAHRGVLDAVVSDTLVDTIDDLKKGDQ
jgi:hypothetical protein